MPNWPEDPRRRNVYGDVYGQSLPMPGQTQPQGIPSLADLATLVNQQQPQQSGLPSPTFQPQQPSLSQLQPPLMPQSQQAVAATDQSPKKPFFSLPDVANALYEGATQQFIPSVKGTVAQLYSGLDRPDLQPAWVQRYQAEGRAAQEMAQRRNEEQAATGKLSSAGEAVRQAIPSLPFSLGSMAAALPAGIAGTVATGPVGGAVAAGAAAGAAGYRMAASQFMDSAFASLEQESQKKRGRPLSEQEKAAAYTELKPVAEHTGLWEAGPEAISNAAMFGLGRVALGFMPKEAMQNLAKTALGRVGIRAGAAAGAAGTEVATETATQVAQGNDQAKADAAIKAFVEGKPMGPAIAGAERPYDGLAGLQKAYNDVVGATLATVVMMGGLAKGAHLAYKPIANRIEAGRRGQEADTAVNQTDPIRTNLEFARESDIAEALSRFDEIENAGRLPKSAARRVDAARQQLLGELSLRVSPESISAPMNSQRGMAGYLGFSERVNELDDAQLADLAGRALPENAEPTLTDAANRYQAEIGRRQALTDSAAHFEQNHDAVIGVAKTLDDIATGKPMSKGAHGSTAFNLASLSDDMLRRYQLAGEVLLRDHSEALGKQSAAVERSLALLNEESQRRAEGQTRDPEAIRESDLAERAATEIAKGKKPNIKGLSFETLERMASGLEARASLEPRLADSARMLREAAQQGRMRAFNPQGQQQPGIQSAMRGWNAVQPESPAQPIDFTQDRARLSELAQQADVTSRQRTILDQEAQRRATREQQRVARSQEIAALNQQNPPLATPQGLPTITPAAIPQSLGQLGQTRLGNGVDQFPIPAQPQPSTPNVTESQGQGRQETSPMGLPARPTGASQSQARGTPEQAASALLRQVPGRLGEQARLNQERVKQQGEWKAFGPDTGTLGIPRADMPQVKAEHRGALVNFLNARGVAHEQDEEVDPTTLKPTQAGFSPKKVQQANEYQGGNRSILVSSDGHVVDGHHQWLSALSKGEPIKAIRLDAPIADLLPLVKEFPSSTESKTTTQPQPEQRREERQAEAAPLLSQEAEQNGNVQKPKAKGVAPTWNSASEAGRVAMISRSSEKAGAPVSNAFAQRKAAEWKTWADIPEGPAKKRLRDYMKSVEQMSMPATMDGGKAAPEKTKNPYATSEERDEAISRLEKAARNSEYRAIRENADLIGDAVMMGATEAEMMAAIEAGDGKALERIADRQHEKTGGLLLGFGNGKLSQPFGYKKVERHPAHDYKNWENLTDAQVNAFSKAASIKPGKTRQETLDRIDSRKTPAEWAEAWDKAFPENRNRLTDIGKAENTPNRTESQEKEPDKKADIKPTKTSSKGASRNRAINATVDAGKDSILTAIAKIGGLDRAEAQRQGIDPAEFKRMPVFGKPVFRKNGGKSFDAMAESLSEFGYPVLDDKGQYSPNVLLDAISRELSGNPVYTPQGIESAARRDAEEQAKFEQDNWLLDAIDLENAGFDALNDQEQVTAQLQAEASRDLGEDAADTIFERISQQHEQATPDQFNEALRAAFDEARQRQSADGREQAGEPGSVQAAGAILQDYSIEELRAEEERIAKSQADQAAKDNAAQQKTEADRARSDFVLTGSNRQADVAMARGQTNLLGAMEGRQKTRFSRAALSPIAKEAISYFGTTRNLEEAGYVLPDGTLLDFSGRSEASKNDYRRDGNHWIWTGKGRDYLSNQRSMDHREVSKLPSINKSSTDAMLAFQRDAKALRIDMMSGRVSANFSDWSPAQMRAAMAIARNNDGSLTIDFDHPVTNRLIRSIDLDRASQAKINALLLEETNKDRRFSRNEISSSLSNSITKARAQLVAALNERSVAALERSGKLILHRTDPTRTGAAGYVDPQGAIHLIPSNMDQDALSVALHEAMHLARDDRFSEGNRAHIRLAHAALKITGLKNFIGNPGFSNLTQQLHRLAAEGNKTAIEALDKARREAPGNVEDEALAYLVQYADEKLPLVRRIIAAIRAALYRMGIKVKLTPADVRALALLALKARAKDAALVKTVRTQESFSLPEFAPTEADKVEVERQMKAIKEIRDGQGRLLAPNGKPSNLNERQWKQVRTKFFKDWFGDWENDPQNSSKVVDANGEPLVVYHGSPDARFISEDATFRSQKERYGFGGELGVHWFASSENTAKTYADVRRAFDYQNADPGVISAFLNIRDPIKIDAGGKKWRDAQKIGKTSDVIDQAQREERDGVIIDNVKDNYQTGVVKGDRPTTTFSVFRSVQIKSAIGNAGTFSARSNRIDYSQPTTETDAAEQDRLWREFQAVRAQFQAKQVSQSAFDRWFGKGVEGVNARNGKPLVLYHGTNNPEFNRWDESRSGQASQHPTAGLGFFMTADKRSAARYGSRLLELHAKIDNPYYMTDADLVSIEDTQDAARFRRKLQAQGYDAAVISAPGGAPYVVALRSNQVKLASNDNPTENEDFRYSMSRVANRFGLTDHEVVDAINSSVDQLTSRDELIRNNVTDVPAKFNRYKIGSAQIETFGGDIKNRYINFLREFDPNDLILSESEEGIKKHPTYQQYVKWAKEGIEPPYIFVAQTESGNLQATNRRRTLAAREAGRNIKGWYGPFNQETGNPLKYGDILDAVAENRYSRPGRRQPLDSPRLASRVLDDIGGVRSTLKPGERALAKANPSNFKQMLSDLSADTRPAWLGFLTRNMQLELAKEVLPAGPVAQFEKSAEQLDADESKMIQTEGFPLADRWQDMMRKDRAQADAVGRALYMSTWLSVDPRTKAPNGKQAEWVRTKAAYDALNPAAKQLYGDVLDFYQKQTDRMFMELDARIDRHSIPAPDKKAMRDQLRREFERVKQDGPYAPLMRFGDLTVFAEPRKAGDKPVFATFESVAEQRAFFDYLKREGYAPQLGVKMEEVVKRNLPQGDFVDDLAAAIDRTMSGPEAQIIKDSMYQLFLRSLPEQAIRKHFMHRKFVPGYSADALRTFATFARRSAKQVARLKHGDLMSDALNQMMKAVKSGTLQEPVAAGHLVNELDKTFQWAMAPTTAQWASKLTSLGFMWHLGASPAHLFLNLSQQAQVTAPWLAGELHGKIGFGSVASALLKANKDFIASNPFVDPAKRSATANKRRQALEAEFGGDLGRALTALEEAGKTDKTQTYSLAGLSEEDSFLWSKPYLRKAIQGAAWFFHTAEVVNREASAIAAYRLGRRSGLNHDQAYDLARRAINESHFDYSPSNRARYMRSNVAKVLTLFKQYSLNISWQLGRNAYLSARGQSPEVRAKARTKLLGMLGMTAVMAGAAGMPFYGEVMWMLTQLINATRDDDEPEKDADLEFRRLLDSAFSPTASEAVRKGLINAFVGVDFSSRIKLGDLWWRSDNRDLSGRDAAYAAMEQALGPVAGLAVRGYSTIDELLAAMVYGENARGDSWRAMETSMPKMLKDISRSIRYMKEGATTYQGARILDPGELNPGAVVGQALGFAPAALADQYEINSAKMKIQTHILRQRRALLDTYAMARAQNDDEVKKAAIEDMRAFNKRYPTIAITRQTLLRSMTSRDRRKAEIEKSGGVALDRRLVDVL